MTSGIRNFETARPKLGSIVQMNRLLQEVHVTVPDRAYITVEHDSGVWKMVRVLTNSIGGRMDLTGCTTMASFRPLKEALNKLLPPEERVRFQAQVELRRSGRVSWYFREPCVINEGIPLHRKISKGSHVDA